MDPNDFFLAWFEVDCDGSACGSENVPGHVHPPQHGHRAIGRVTVRNGTRTGYTDALGITRLVEDVSGL